ncbi:hypothetical protein ABAC460_10840 [Asticcacaulis sp. AC460]|uniref:serine hydrolase domain-containing protein n=1 Tax=Asticcacaulis sp. AC460 TaxID=1282360 RepID=UPI0003C40177|nr:serine hydrolase domain-containing protein [Asticcacaulis sp. AC460]ESQ90237.1 hypothetical protein ABAC460_10840 [Asticcacaulis sp. AC460]
MRAVLLAFSLSFLPVAVFAQTPTDNPGQSSLDLTVQTAAETFFADGCHVGLSMAVYDRGNVHFYNYGTTSKAKPVLPSKDSLYEIGSVTKTFTGVLASRAILDGKMTLDGDFRAYLKDAYPNLEKNGKPVTLRTLASHTSGLQRDIPDNDALFVNADFEKLPYQLLALEKGYDRPRYLKELHDVQLRTEPGQTMAYSNFGIKLISFGLEHVYGDDFEDLLGKQVFEPLGMTDTGFTVSWRDRGRRVKGYGIKGAEVPYIRPNVGAAGGLISSTADMVRYVAWHLDESDPVVAKAHDLIFGDVATYGEGLIWQVNTRNGERKLWQSGGVFGMSSQVILFPDAKQAYVLLANDACMNTQGQLETLALAVHDSMKN